MAPLRACVGIKERHVASTQAQKPRLPLDQWNRVVGVTGGLWPSGDPSREDEADGNDAGEDYRYHEEVFPAQECDHDEARREAPCDDWHRQQGLFGQASEAPRQDCDEDQKDRDEEPEASVEVPIGPV